MSSYVITGGNRGIGLEFVRQLSTNPSNAVFALVRNKATSKDLVEIQNSNQNVHILEGDITDVKALKAAANEVSNVTGGTLDVLINNAGYVPVDRTELTPDGYSEGQEDLLEKDYIDTFKINVLGVIHTINVFLPLLRSTSTKSTAKVISLTTGLADVDFTLATEFAIAGPYSVSKAALNMAVAKYAAELKKENIVFLSISPGLVNTSTTPPTQEEIEQFSSMVGAFQRAAPGWDGKPLTPPKSVQYMLKVIEGITPKDSGAVVSHFGNKQWL